MLTVPLDPSGPSNHSFVILDEAGRMTTDVRLGSIFPHADFIVVIQMLMERTSEEFALTLF
jgi:hypothetical protein